MTTDSAQAPWTVQGLLDLFDVQPDGENRYTAETGPAGQDERQVVEGTQVLAQMIVADANVSEMPMTGRQLRLVDVVDVNSPDEVGPPELYA